MQYILHRLFSSRTWLQESFSDDIIFNKQWFDIFGTFTIDWDIAKFFSPQAYIGSILLLLIVLDGGT